MEHNQGRHIICPYCFAKFYSNQVVFRATKGFSRSELQLDDDEEMGGLLATYRKPAAKQEDERVLFQRFDTPPSNGEDNGDQKLDHKLINYWKDRGGAAGYMHQDKYWDYPHIDPADPDTYWKMIRTDSVGGTTPDADGMIRDADDGFVRRVFDKYTEPGVGVTMDRLCPDCHNPLPLATYGKYPVKFIGVIGMTSAGKTVFLNQLVNNIFSLLAGTDYIVGADNLNEFGQRIKRTAPLPGSTDSSVVRRPLAVELLTKDPAERANSMTLVFYDIAGELCVNKNGDGELARAQTTIGYHIANSDALIFLLDPNQIPAFAEGDLSEHTIDNVIHVISSIRSSDFHNTNSGWNDVPVAICVAKSDKLRDHPALPREVPFFENPDLDVRDFDRESNRSVHDFLRNLLRERSPSVYAALQSFPERAYFMLSAINCGVESRVEKYKNWYILDDVNEKRFRALSRWCKEWNQRSPLEREHMRGCPVRTRDGAPIAFQKTDSITERNSASIVTEITGVTDYGDALELTIWDVASKLNPVGFPKGDPSFYRLLEPVKWILWRMGEIGPELVYPDPPMKRPFESRRHYNDRYAQYELDCEDLERRFYWRDPESL